MQRQLFFPGFQNVLGVQVSVAITVRALVSPHSSIALCKQGRYPVLSACSLLSPHSLLVPPEGPGPSGVSSLSDHAVAL